MLQPFEIFRLEYIPRLVNLKKTWLVSQSYPRGIDELQDEKKESILLSDYDDPGLAKVHLNAVKHHKYAAIIDLKIPKHRAKLEEMLGENSKYQVFWCIVRSARELETRVNARWKENMRRYIEKHTNWRIDRNATLKPSLQVTFGELFIVLKHGSQTLRIKFDEIEKV